MAGKGATIEAKRRVITDAATGREVWAIGPRGAKSGAAYMYITSFTPDERYVFFTSNVSGSPQLHRLDIESGLLTQFTAAERFDPYQWNVHPSGEEVFYRIAGKYLAADVETGEERLVFDPLRHEIREPRQQIMFSPSGTWFSFSYLDDDCIAVARAACDGSGNLETVHRRPPGEGVQHVMFCNVDDDLMSFSPSPDHQQEWDAPTEMRARTYIIHAASGKAEPFLLFPKPFTTTHDYWSPRGDRLYFHKKTRPTWVPTWINCLDRRTRQEQEKTHRERAQPPNPKGTGYRRILQMRDHGSLLFSEPG